MSLIDTFHAWEEHGTELKAVFFLTNPKGVKAFEGEACIYLNIEQLDKEITELSREWSQADLLFLDKAKRKYVPEKEPYPNADIKLAM